MGTYTDEYIHSFSEKGSKTVADAFGRVGKAAGGVGGGVGKAMNMLVGMGPQMQMAGQRGLQLSNEWSVLSMHAQQVDTTFESLAKKSGLSDKSVSDLKEFARGMIDVAGVRVDDTLAGMNKLFSFGFADPEKLKALMPTIAAQARDYGMTINESAKAIGKAISGGNVGALTRSGVLTMDLETRAAVKHAKALLASGNAADFAAGQNEILNLVIANSTKYASSNAAYMETSAGKLAAYNAHMEKLKEGMGAGVNQVKAWEAEFGMGVLKTLGMTDESAQKAAGSFMFVGSQALTATGSILNAVKGLKEWQIALKMNQALDAGGAIPGLGGRGGGLSDIAGPGARALGGGGAGLGLFATDVTALGTAGAATIATAIGGSLAAAGIGWMIGSVIAKQLEGTWAGGAVKGTSLLTDEEQKRRAPAVTQADITQLRKTAEHKELLPAAIRARRAALLQQQPGGDITVRIPRGTVPTNQQFADHRYAR